MSEQMIQIMIHRLDQLTPPGGSIRHNDWSELNSGDLVGWKWSTSSFRSLGTILSVYRQPTNGRLVCIALWCNAPKFFDGELNRVWGEGVSL